MTNISSALKTIQANNYNPQTTQPIKQRTKRLTQKEINDIKWNTQNTIRQVSSHLKNKSKEDFIIKEQNTLTQILTELQTPKNTIKSLIEKYSTPLDTNLLERILNDITCGKETIKDIATEFTDLIAKKNPIIDNLEKELDTLMLQLQLGEIGSTEIIQFKDKLNNLLST